MNDSISIRVEDVVCGYDKHSHMYIDKCIAKLTVVFDPDTEIKELFNEYSMIDDKLDDIGRQSLRLVYRIADKHMGKLVRVYSDGSVLLEKGLFRKKKVRIWDEELSPRLAKLFDEERRLHTRLNELFRMIKEHVLRKLGIGGANG